MEGAARGRPASRLRTCRFLRPLWFCSGLSPFPQGRIAPPLLLPPPHLSGGSHPLVEIGKPGRQVGVRNIPASQRKKLRFGGLGARPAAAASAQGGRGHVCGAGAPGASGKARGRCERRPGVGSPPGAGRGGGGGPPRSAPAPRRGPEPLQRLPAVRAGLSRLHARARPPRPRALRRFAHRAAQTAARRARGRGPGVQRGPRRGPAPRPGRMRPGAARELSRAPAPSPTGPGFQSRSRRPAPGRHDFQAAFRLDSLQVRGRRPHLPFSSGARARPTTLQRSERAAPSTPTRGAGPLYPSHPTLRARAGGAGPSYPNFGPRAD